MAGISRAVILAISIWLVVPADADAAGDPLVYAVQEALAEEGYDPGWPDGLLGPRTGRAIRAFEADYGLPLTGTLTHELVTVLDLAAYASELGFMDLDRPRKLAAPVGVAGDRPRKLAPPVGMAPVGVTDVSIDTNAPGRPEADSQRPAVTDRQLQPLSFQVRQHLSPEPVIAEEREATNRALEPGAAARPEAEPHIPAVEDRFAPRNWLIRDLRPDGSPMAPPVGMFLEEGGSVAGPRYAKRLHWEADGAHFTMTYRNSIGQEIKRSGTLNGLNRIEGEAVGPDGRVWRWQAEARPM